MGSIPIFVSSTFTDFHYERDVIRRQVREQLNEHVATFGHCVEVIDLRAGIEALGHVSQQERHVLDICFDEIDRARPLFLGLVGLRAGLVPEPSHARWTALRAGHAGPLGLEGLSITELEISHATLWPSAPKGHHVILLRDLDGPSPDGWSDADLRRVVAFRSRLKKVAGERTDLTLAPYSVRFGRRGPELGGVSTPGGTTNFEDWVVGLLRPGVLRRAHELSAAAVSSTSPESNCSVMSGGK